MALTTSSSPTLADRLNHHIHGESPFVGFDAEAWTLDLQGWASTHPVLTQSVDQIKPRLIIEVGTWKGASAIHMLKTALQHGDAAIICVDTWLGSPEQWTTRDGRESLRVRNGRPTLYEQFMANVIHCGLQNHVVPLPLTSRLAAITLSAFKITAPLIYVDGAHDEASVREDSEAYWPLVTQGGLIIGDDYTPGWPGVIAAVAGFTAAHGDEILTHGDLGGKWFAQKKPAAD